MFIAIQQGACDIEKKDVKALMDYYAKKMLLHAISKILED